jgi:ribosomal protein S18 acetylase RimI-like enzyme
VTDVVVSPWLDEDLAPLLAAYHLRTEAEKGVAAARPAELPERYRREVLRPREAFAGAAVLVARVGDTPVGCVVATAPAGGSLELKRLWVDPAHRGRGAAKALVGAVFEHAARNGVDSVRLSVWRWRRDALALYERLGFTEVESWDDRDHLVCMARAVAP